ncbi:MAG: leucine-rich repeat domain-containing protein [Spirochaetes bacterium]|nr:leucine-rich repeat domain-containing protein [Spirochaetota bacterium]
MADTIDSIYRELKKQVNPHRLKEISVDIIARYRAHDRDGLAFYGELLGLDTAAATMSRLFASIIQQYHPDKLTKIINEIEDHFKNNKLEEMVRLRDIFIFKGAPRPLSYRPEIRAEETYGYGDDDFGYDEKAVYEEDFTEGEEIDEFEEAYEDHERGFIEALTRLVFGNLDLAITIEDVQGLEGELDLSDYDIVDLKGVEHCMNISSLNLSGNDIRSIGPLSRLTQLESLFLSGNGIRNISPLAGLVNLKELDISFNEIEDISVLKSCDSLLYVNLMGNPVRDAATIRELTERGVLVVY